MFFEKEHSFNEEEFNIFGGQNFSFMSHIHRSFELYLQTEGTSEVVIDKRAYILKPGQAVLIFPFQYHSYRAIENSAHNMCIFSPGLVPDFYGNGKFIPTDNLFAFSWSRKTADNPFLYRSIAYEICGEFDKERTYAEKKNLFAQDKVVSVLLYVNENYKQKCLLYDASASVGFDYAYISKLFKKSIGITYNQYVNYLRIQDSKRLLKTSEKTISEIALECGFLSLRVFNRKFSEIEGITPSAYRNQQKMFYKV